jgi:Phosphoketolase
MITRNIKIKKGARNAARSDRGAAKSTVKRALRTPKKAVNNDGATSHGTARSTIKGAPLSRDELDKIDAYWRAANYLSVGQIYLYDNPLLKKPLKKEHVKPRLLGHWGTLLG